MQMCKGIRNTHILSLVVKQKSLTWIEYFLTFDELSFPRILKYLYSALAALDYLSSMSTSNQVGK